MRGIYLAAGAIVIILLFWKLQFATDAICCGDFDGYYHIKWSRMLWEGLRNGAFPPVFTWLPLTTLNPNDYADHHLLFHFFQIPFTFGDLRLGAKVASIIFASLALISCYWLLIYYRIRFIPVWLLALLACSAPFLFRMSMAKAPPLTIIYLVVAIFLLFKEKYWPLIPLAFLFTLTYDMFVLLILAVVIWVVVIAWTERRFEWRPLVWVLLGTLAGLIINPYFPQNLQLFYEHLTIKLQFEDFSTKVGNEWYPYTSWEFLGTSLVACVAMLVGYIAFDPADRKRAHHPLFFLLFSTALMIMTARWKRIVEYWPPFAVMFAAFALQPWLMGPRSAFTRLPADVMKELEPFLDRSEPVPNKGREIWIQICAAAVAIVLGAALAFNLYLTWKDIEASEPHDHYRAGTEWMRENVTSAQIIFNTDWDDFPRLFYFDPSHNYVAGLDPSYLFERSPELWKLYERITLGHEEDPGPLIKERFGARYVFTDNGHDSFFANAMESGWFDIVYEDTDCTILRIRDEKGKPPTEEGEPGDVPTEEPPPNEEP
jgi:hypothetical protein